jgi:hypothetical protein
MKTDKQFVNTLEDNIREGGAMSKLISDRAQVEISNKVTDILRALFISRWQSEPHQQHQNYAEKRYQTVKTIREKLGRFVGIAENVGHFMRTFKILTGDTKKLIFRSNVRSALDPPPSKAKNLCLDPLSGETSIPVIIKSCHKSDSSDNKEYQRTPSMPIFHPSDLVGKTFLMDPMEDRQRH